MDSGKTVITGAVLRTTDTKEADKILTVLSPQLGKIPVTPGERGEKTAVWPRRASCWPTMS